MSPRGRRFSLLLSLLFCFFTLTAHAQFRAGVQGTVLDPTGAVIPGAKVTVTNQATGISQETTATGEGFYRIVGLPPGRYRIKVEAANFQAKTVSDVDVAAELVRGLNVSLEPGAVTEEITVTEQAGGVVQTENADISKTLTQVQVESLPVFARDPYELVRLTPGILGDGARGGAGGAIELPNNSGPGGSDLSIFQVENQVQISANGNRVSANNYQLDGVSVNSLQWGGATVVTPSKEAVQEVTVLATSYSAEEGRNSGAQVKVVSKSGSNNWHGGAFFQYNDPGLNSDNEYSDITSTTPPQLVEGERVRNRYRQGGANLGGPIFRDKLFFFFNWETLHNNASSTYSEWVETPEFRNLVIQQRPGSVTAAILSAPGVEPRIEEILPADCAIFGANPCQVVPGGVDVGSPIGMTGEYVPIGDFDGGGLDGIPDLQFARFLLPSEQKANQYFGRVDFTPGLNRFFVSTVISTRDDLNAKQNIRSRPMADISFKPLNATITAAWIRPFGTTWLNEARFNFTRFDFDTLETTAENLPTNFGLPLVEIEGYPFDRIRFGPNRSETEPARFAQNTFEFRDGLSWILGNHGLKFGGGIRWEQDYNNLFGGDRPVYSFQKFWNFVNDAPIFEGINLDPQTGGVAITQRHYHTQDYALYVQDDWKARPNLTLNMGVRWEYYTALQEQDGLLSNLTDPLNIANTSVQQVSDFYGGDWNNVAPRLGFAWSPGFLGGGVVLRGGYGIGYNRIPNALFANSRGNPPFMGRFNICCGTAATDFGTPFVGGQIQYVLGSSNSPFSFPANTALAQGFGPDGLPVAGAVEIYGAFNDTRVGYVQNYSLELQFPVPWSMVAEFGYAGSTGRKLIRLLNLNFIQVPNPKIFAAYFPTDDINSNYNALNARLSKRFTGGLMFDLIYRWSKSLDHLSNEGPGAQTNQTNPANLDTEWGPSDFDARHFLSLSGVWEPPIFRNRSDFVGSIFGGWEMSGILTYHSGFPWTPVTGRQNSVAPVTGAATINPTRPIAFFGGVDIDSGDAAYMPPGGNFPEAGTACNTPAELADCKGFDISAPGPPGIGRNAFSGPRYFSIDMSFSKAFRLPATALLGEGAQFRLRANLLNAFDMLNLEPIGFGSDSARIENPRFGLSRRALAGRVIELQARFEF